MENSGSGTSAASIFSSLFGKWPPPVLAACVLIISLTATTILWRNSLDQAEAVLQADFDYQAAQMTTAIRERMLTYEQIARGTQAFILSSQNVGRAEFQEYVQLLGLQERFPGLQGIAYIKAIAPSELQRHITAVRSEGFPDYTVHPTGERPLYSSIVQIEPFTVSNQRAFGFDMLSNPTRRIAMERARDSGEAAASGKVTLIQEGSEQPQSGLVIYLPVYGVGMPTETVEERRESLVAWVGAPFRMNDLMRGLGGYRSGDLIVTIYDGDKPDEEAVLYHSMSLLDDPLASALSLPQPGQNSGAVPGAPPQPHIPLFSMSTHLVISGRPWTLAMKSGPGLESRMDYRKPTLVAWLGMGASVMLSLLVWSLATGRRRAVSLANSMTHQLRESEFRWKYALEGAGDGVWDLNADTGRIVYSKRWKEMLGYSESEIRDDLSEWERLLHPDDREQALTAAREYLSGRVKHYSNEFRMRCKDGSYRWIHARSSPVSYKPDGSVLRTIGTHTDITTRKEAERLELEKTRALNEARDSLRHAQKLEAVGKLTGGVAHDFNNVLQIMAGNIQMLQFVMDASGRLDAEVETRLGSMLSAVEKGSKLSSQLLAFARRQPLQPVTLNLLEVIHNMEDLLHRALGESVRLELASENPLWNTFADPSRLENVILNLAINARDAMPRGGVLSIRLGNVSLGAGADAASDAEHAIRDEQARHTALETALKTAHGDEAAQAERQTDVYARPLKELQSGEYVLLALSDTGTGMSAEVLEQAFEPFFTTKPAGEGTGLGLSMAYGFVKQSGGDIRIDSAPGRGTTISIYLPRSLQTVANNAAHPVDTVAGGDETILVVEDDLEVQTTVSSMLGSLGYRVIKADDAQRALQIIDAGVRPDLLFTDVVMPGPLTAPELAREARKRYPEIAILFTSGYTRNALVSGGRLEEGVQLLSKPYRREELARKVRQILSQAGEGMDAAEIVKEAESGTG